MRCNMSEADVRKGDGQKAPGQEEYERATPRARCFIDLLVGVSDKPLTQPEAYALAGYTGGSPASAAATLAHRYRAAIDWRRDQLSEDSARQRLRTLRRLEAFAEGSLRHVLGDELVLTEERWRELPDEVAALVSELTVDETTTTDGARVRKVKIKLEPRQAAEALRAKLFGWLAPKKLEHDFTDAETAREKLEEALRRRREAQEKDGE